MTELRALVACIHADYLDEAYCSRGMSCAEDYGIAVATHIHGLNADFRDLTDIGIPGYQPSLSPTTLAFAAGPTSTSDLYVSSLSGGVVGAPVRIDSLATAEVEQHPVISAEDLEIAFVRGARVLTARRAATTQEFGDVQPVESGIIGTAQPAGFSADRCRLYLTIAQTGTAASLHVLSRP